MMNPPSRPTDTTLETRAAGPSDVVTQPTVAESELTSSTWRDARRQRLRRMVALAPRVLPFTSLAFSVVSATLMNRHPHAAPRIVAVALLGWALVVLTAVVVRRIDAADRRSRLARVGRFVSLLASQLALGQALAFPLPFFALAAWPPLLIHVPFAVAYVVAVVVVAWDPFFERVAVRSGPLLLLQAFAGLVAMLAVLPMLGLDNTRTFVVAGVVVGVGVPVGSVLFGLRDRRHLMMAGLGAAVVAVIVVVGAPLVPPAPLRLTAGVMAIRVEARLPRGVGTHFTRPPSLFCHTAIAAPLGLKDALRHVWTRDGVMVQEVNLEVSGGAGTGFRTWSRVSKPAPGQWRCRVETARGQVVGDVKAVVD